MIMRKLMLVGFTFSALALIAGSRGEASGGLFSRHCHHDHCDAQQSTVRLPAQQIRIETAAPRVVVQETRHHRHNFGVGVGVPFVPVVGQPIVATFFTPQVQAPVSSGSPALKAAHDLEMQALEVARLRAAHQAEVAAINDVHGRIMQSMSRTVQGSQTTTTDLSKLTAEIEKLTNRVSDIEKLLIIHDNLLKEIKEKK